MAGDVSFLFPVEIGSGSTRVIAADLDRDGDHDLVVSNTRDDDLSVLLNQGSGEFSQRRYATAERAPVEIAVGDLDGDLIPDLVVSTAGKEGHPGTFSVLRGSGDGTFLPAVSYSTGGNSAGGVVLGDFDGDGDLDVAATHEYSQDVSVLLGAGDGTFAEATQYPSASGGDGTIGITAGDFDRDGDLDLAVSNYLISDGADAIGVLLGNGDGTFEPLVSYSAPNSWDLKNADLDGDGILDLVITTIGGPSIMRGNGDGTFAEGELYRDQTHPPGADWRNPDPANPILQPFGLDLGDVDGDGVLDLVLANWSGQGRDGSIGMLSVMLGAGDGTFADPVTLEAGVWPQSVAIVDLDGDGDADLAVPDNQSERLTLLFNSRIHVKPGDANRDGVFDQLDIVRVLQSAKYLTGEPATFEEGDWNDDGVFDPWDIVTALALGDYSPRIVGGDRVAIRVE